MSNDIRLTRLKLEAIEINSKLSSKLQESFRNDLPESSQLNENKLTDWVKSKVMGFFQSHKGDVSAELPAINQKIENAKEQLKAQGKEEVVDKLEQGLKQIEAKYKNRTSSNNRFVITMAVGTMYSLLALLAVPAGAVIFLPLLLTTLGGLVAGAMDTVDISSQQSYDTNKLKQASDRNEL